MASVTNIASIQRRLSRAGVAQLAAKLQQKQSELLKLDQELLRARERVSLLSMLWPFGQSEYEQQATAIGATKKQLQTEHIRLQEQWCELLSNEAKQSRPLAVVFEIAKQIQRARRDLAVGCNTKQNKETAQQLEALADGLLQTWAPNVSLPAIAAALADDATRQAVGRQATAVLASDPELGWAPVQAEELGSMVAQALESNPRFLQLRNEAHRQHREWLAACQAFAEAKATVSTSDRLNVFSDSPSEKRRDHLENERLREHGEAYWAFEHYHHALLSGFAVHPVLWLHMALLGAAACLHSIEEAEELYFTSEGQADVGRNRQGRATFFACMVEVRRATERAFPGLFGLAWPTSEEAKQANMFEGSPYRQSALDESSTEATDPELDADEHFFERLEKKGLRLVLARAVGTASMVGLLHAAARSNDESVHWFDRLAFWSDTSEELQRDQLEERKRSLKRHLNRQIDAALYLLQQQASEHPYLGLGQALLSTIQTVAAITTEGGESSSARVCNVLKRSAAYRALAATRGSLERFFGIRGSRSEWLQDSLQALASAKAIEPASVTRTQDGRLNYAGAIFEICEALRPTPFVSLCQNNQAQYQQLASASAAEQQAKDAVPLLDKLNVFSDSKAEQARNRAEQVAETLRNQTMQSGGQLQHLIQAAFHRYPPLLLAEQLEALRHHVGNISAHSRRRTRTHKTRDAEGRVISQRTETYYVCVLSGTDAARQSEEQVRQIASHRFDAFPTPSLMLERWVLREL